MPTAVPGPSCVADFVAVHSLIPKRPQPANGLPLLEVEVPTRKGIPREVDRPSPSSSKSPATGSPRSGRLDGIAFDCMGLAAQPVVELVGLIPYLDPVPWTIGGI